MFRKVVLTFGHRPERLEISIEPAEVASGT